MTEVQKKHWFIFFVILCVSIIILSWIGYYKEFEKQQEIAIAVDRTPLISYRLLDYRENSDGAFFDIVSLEDGRKYENVFISKTCPRGKTKSPGMIMLLSAVKYYLPNKGTTYVLFDRAYDYVCTNKDMEKEDEILLTRIKEARDRKIQEMQNSQKN